jgi:hypothetical protein
MAERVRAAVGSLAFLVLAPGGVAALVPWLITGWLPLPPGDGPAALRCPRSTWHRDPGVVAARWRVCLQGLGRRRAEKRAR